MTDKACILVATQGDITLAQGKIDSIYSSGPEGALDSGKTQRKFSKSPTADGDLKTLADLRDGNGRGGRLFQN